LRPTVLGKLPAAVLNEHFCTCRENLATPPIEPCGIALPGRKAAQVFPFPRHSCQIVLRARTQQRCGGTAPHFRLATRKLAGQWHLLPRICSGSGTEFIFERMVPPKLSSEFPCGTCFGSNDRTLAAPTRVFTPHCFAESDQVGRRQKRPFAFQIEKSRNAT